MSNMSRGRKAPKKVTQARGAGEIQRAKSGGAVKGPIPKAGGTNAMDFEKGEGYSIETQKAYAERKAKE